MTIQAAVSDDDQVADVSFAWNGGPGAAMATDSDGRATASWDTTTVDNGTHELVVRARDAAGNTSEARVTLTVDNPDVTPPSTPAGFRTQAVGPTSVGLGWSASSDDRGVVGYRIRRTGPRSGGPGTDWTDSSVAPGRTHAYTLEALDAAGNGSVDPAQLPVRTPETQDTTPPTVPALQAAPSGADVVLTWSPSSDDGGSRTTRCSVTAS